MATRSRIATLNSDGSVESIYCHYDGYPDHNGNVLLNFFQDLEKVKELISGGDISSISSEGIIKRMESGNDCPELESDIIEFEHYAWLSSEEYVYLFIDDKWYFKEKEDLKFKNLFEYLKNEKMLVR